MRARAAGHRLVAMPPDGARIRHHDQEARSNALVLLLKSAGGLRSVPYSRIHLLTTQICIDLNHARDSRVDKCAALPALCAFTPPLNMRADPSSSCVSFGLQPCF